MKEVFYANLLKQSQSQIIMDAKKEWIYIGQVKHSNKISSPSFYNRKDKMIRYSVTYYNFKTNKIFHAGTSTQYLIRNKGHDTTKIFVQDPQGNGKCEDVNMSLLNKIQKFIMDIKAKRKSDIKVNEIKILIMYKHFLNSIEISQQDIVYELIESLELILIKNYVLTCIYCQVEFLREYNFPSPICSECFLKNKK